MYLLFHKHDSLRITALEKRIASVDEKLAQLDARYAKQELLITNIAESISVKNTGGTEWGWECGK